MTLSDVRQMSRILDRAYDRMTAPQQPRAIRKYARIIIHTVLDTMYEVGAITPDDYRKIGIEIERTFVQFCPEHMLH